MAAEEPVETSTALMPAITVRTTLQDTASGFSLAKTIRLASVSARPTPLQSPRAILVKSTQAARSAGLPNPREGTKQQQVLAMQRLGSGELHQVKCCARCLFISNMVTLSLPNTLRSLSSARISRRFSGFCKLLDLM